MLGGFVAKARAMRRKPSWGQERQGESCVTTIIWQHYLSSPSSLSVHISHNKSTWSGEKSNYTFHTCFFPLSFHSPLSTNLPTVYRAPPREHKDIFSPHTQQNLVLTCVVKNTGKQTWCFKTCVLQNFSKLLPKLIINNRESHILDHWPSVLLMVGSDLFPLNDTQHLVVYKLDSWF